MAYNTDPLSLHLSTVPHYYGVERVLINTTIYDRDGNTFAHKIGRMAGRTKNFFSRQETKTATLVAYWAFETAFYGTLLMMMTSYWMYIGLFSFWAYGTYALFSTINNTR